MHRWWKMPHQTPHRSHRSSAAVCVRAPKLWLCFAAVMVINEQHCNTARRHVRGMATVGAQVFVCPRAASRTVARICGGLLCDFVLCAFDWRCFCLRVYMARFTSRLATPN